MPGYSAPVENVLFLLRDVLGYERFSNLPGFADAPLDLVEAVLGEAARFCEDVLQPLNRTGDLEGCVRHDDGSVTTPAGFKDAYRTYAEAGWVGLSADPRFGGQGLPYTIAAILNEFVTSANMAWGMYPGLTQGAIAALVQHGSAEQQALYLPKLVSGKWSGTMNLTEPQCGTDLGLIKTKAVPAGDGSYRISGQKIFISAGEHDLTENIVHLVLARIEGAPAGVKGISLFVVPKFLPDEAGDPGARNAVSCGSIEKKMGIHGNATCVMNYDGATGWLVGEADKGLRAMFTMMNDARLGVAVQGLAMSEVAGQNAAVLCARAPPGPRLDRRAGRGGGGRPDPRPSRHPPHPHVHPLLQRGGARAVAVDGAEGRCRPPLGGREGPPRRRRPHGAADAGAEGRADRQGLRERRRGAAGLRRPRLHRRARHGAIRPRRPHRHDLRGRERHPGARPRRPQAAEGRRPRRHGLLRRGRRVHQGERAERGAGALRRAAEGRASTTCRKRPCGSCRMP